MNTHEKQTSSTGSSGMQVPPSDESATDSQRRKYRKKREISNSLSSSSEKIRKVRKETEKPLEEKKKLIGKGKSKVIPRDLRLKRRAEFGPRPKGLTKSQWGVIKRSIDKGKPRLARRKIETYLKTKTKNKVQTKVVKTTKKSVKAEEIKPVKDFKIPEIYSHRVSFRTLKETKTIIMHGNAARHVLDYYPGMGTDMVALSHRFARVYYNLVQVDPDYKEEFLYNIGLADAKFQAVKPERKFDTVFFDPDWNGTWQVPNIRATRYLLKISKRLANNNRINNRLERYSEKLWVVEVYPGEVFNLDMTQNIPIMKEPFKFDYSGVDLRFAKQFSNSVQISKRTSHHPKARFVREFAVYNFLKQTFKNGEIVVDWQGSHVTAHLANELFKRGQRIELYIYRDTVNYDNKDVQRRQSLSQWDQQKYRNRGIYVIQKPEDVPTRAVHLMVNLYYWNPRKLYLHCKEYNVKNVVWFGHLFHGPYGIYHEAFWKREANYRGDQITFYPSKHEQPYVHPPCDWLKNVSADGFVIAHEVVDAGFYRLMISTSVYRGEPFVFEPKGYFKKVSVPRKRPRTLRSLFSSWSSVSTMEDVWIPALTSDQDSTIYVGKGERYDLMRTIHSYSGPLAPLQNFATVWPETAKEIEFNYRAYLMQNYGSHMVKWNWADMRRWSLSFNSVLDYDFSVMDWGALLWKALMGGLAITFLLKNRRLFSMGLGSTTGDFFSALIRKIRVLLKQASIRIKIGRYALACMIRGFAKPVKLIAKKARNIRNLDSPRLIDLSRNVEVRRYPLQSILGAVVAPFTRFFRKRNLLSTLDERELRTHLWNVIPHLKQMSPGKSITFNRAIGSLASVAAVMGMLEQFGLTYFPAHYQIGFGLLEGMLKGSILYHTTLHTMIMFVRLISPSASIFVHGAFNYGAVVDMFSPIAFDPSLFLLFVAVRKLVTSGYYPKVKFAGHIPGLRIQRRKATLPFGPYEEARMETMSVKVGRKKYEGTAAVKFLEKEFDSIEENDLRPVVPVLSYATGVSSPPYGNASIISTILHRDIAKTPVPVEVANERWKLLGKEVLNLRWPLIRYAPYSMEVWIQHFRQDKRDRYERAYELMFWGKIEPSKPIAMFPKRDEKLYKVIGWRPEDKGKKAYVKYRSLHDWGPFRQALIGPDFMPWAKGLQHKFALLNPWMVDYNFYVSMASANPDYVLGEWFHRALCMVESTKEKIMFCIVGGDDGAAIYRPRRGGPILFLEWDFSKYDQSICTEAMNVRWELYKKMGLSPKTIDHISRFTHGDLKGKLDDKRDGSKMRVKIARSKHTSMSTGAPDTKDGNSITNIPCVWSYFKYDTWDRTGMGVKLQIHRDYRKLTFLKGTWYPYKSTYLWRIMPSRLIKAGTFLTEPVAMLPKHLRKKVSEQFAYRFALWASAKGIEVYRDMPLLSAYIKKGISYEAEVYKRLGKDVAIRCEQTVNRKIYQFKPKFFTDAQIDRELYFRHFALRYNFSPSQAIELERIILSAERFPFIVDHPVLYDLQCVDYS
jgi:hypothetical protein